MPPVRIKKEDIIKGTIMFIKTNGIEELSARNLAKSINCSTQPLFKQFENMDDLKSRPMYAKLMECGIFKNAVFITKSGGRRVYRAERLGR